MARILSKQRVVSYSKEYKVKIVLLTELESIQIKEICECLDLHPFMVSRWRKQYKDGTLVASKLGKVEVATKKSPPSKKKLSEIERLKKQNTRLKKENGLLKKWRRYLAEVRQNDSDS